MTWVEVVTPVEPEPEPSPPPEPEPEPSQPPLPPPEPEPEPSQPAPPPPEPEPEPSQPAPPPPEPEPEPSQPAPPQPETETIPSQLRPKEQSRTEVPPSDLLEDIAATLENLPRAEQVSQLGIRGNVARERLQSLFNSQLRKCWIITPESVASGNIVRIRIHLRPDGFLMRPPELLASENQLNQDQRYRSMADAARRAVLNCEPFQIPRELYFEEFIFNFNPSQVNSE